MVQWQQCQVTAQVQHLLAEELVVVQIMLILGGHLLATMRSQGPRTGGHMRHLIHMHHMHHFKVHLAQWAHHCRSRRPTWAGTEILED